MRSSLRVHLLLTAFTLFGAGCASSPIVVTKTAESIMPPLEARVGEQGGFGKLPHLTRPQNKINVTLAKPLPAIPASVTVLHIKPGTLNATELANLSSSLELTPRTIGSEPVNTELLLKWTDAEHGSWDVDAYRNSVEFVKTDAEPQPYTVRELPASDSIAAVSDTFLQARGIPVDRLRQGLVIPDWKIWWETTHASGHCYGTENLQEIRAIGASDPLLNPAPPTLPLTTETNCVTQELPSHVAVRYHLFVDGQDVVDANGDPIEGAEFAVDTTRKMVTHARFFLFQDPDRSDYVSYSQDEILKDLQEGGTSHVTGNITITDYHLGFVETIGADGTQFLVPAFIAEGKEGRIVLPLASGV